MRAHLYGGANIVAGLGSIGANNAAFAERFMAAEGIVIGHCDLGGTHARKVEFMPFEGKARSIAVSAPPIAVPERPRSVSADGELELF